MTRTLRKWTALGSVTAVLAAALFVPGFAAAAPASAPFELRGVIEGFYGPMWSHEGRLELFPWMRSHGLNTYINAPKDDPYQRANWRDPYPPEQLAPLLEEVKAAAEHGVAWVPNLSPGFPLIPGRPIVGAAPSQDVCFSCPGDLEVIAAKFDPFFDAGARTILLSFDDVNDISTHPEDAATYGAGEVAYGEMNRDLINAVYRRYHARDASFRLLTVLSWYFGTTDTTGYFEGIRADGGLDPGVVVFWTGPDVASNTLSPDDAAAYAALVGRDKVAVWDNYPANDYTGNIVGEATRVFLGPYEGRAPDLDRAVLGIVANPMNELTASRIALATFADYLGAPAAYEPESSWRASIADLAPSRGADHAASAVAALAENSRSGSLNRLESPVFESVTQNLLAQLDASPFWGPALEVATAELAREHAASGVVRARLPTFAAEVSPWLDQLASNAAAAQAAVDLVVAQRPTLTVTTTRTASITRLVGRAAAPSPGRVNAASVALAEAHERSLADPHAVHGDRATPHVLGAPNVAENRLDAFVAVVKARLAQWIPLAPLAASGVTVTVDGVPVPLGADGAFNVVVPRGARMVEVIARDGASGTTGTRVSLPPPRREGSR